MIRLCYLLKRLPLKAETKLRLFLNLEWIFSRLAHEMSYEVSMPFYEHDEFLLKHISKDDSVVDLGCGTGRLIKIISEKTPHVTGIDNDRKSLEKAKKSCNALFIKANIEPYICQGFNIAILSHVLEHLYDPVAYLKNLSKEVKRIYISTPDIEQSRINMFRHLLGVKLRYSDLDHKTEFDREALKMIVTDMGLKIIAEEYRYGNIYLWVEK